MNEVIFSMLIAFAVIERLWKYWRIKVFLGRTAPTSGAQKVSIVQPIMSGDPTMWQALEANLLSRTNYQRTFYWMLDEGDEDALHGCTTLAQRHPEVKIEIVVLPRAPQGWSPKTFKLVEGFARTNDSLIAALDDDTALPDFGLDKSLPYLDQPGVGSVFGVPYYVSFQNFWSAMVSAFVNAASTWIYIPYTTFVDPFAINGMYFAFKKDVYNAVGGFSGIEGNICDDYAMARRIISHKLRLVETPLLHPIRINIDTAAAYMGIISRWFVFTKASVMTAQSWNLTVFYLVVFIPTFFPLSLLVLASWLNTPFVWTLYCLYAAIFTQLAWRVNVNFLDSATPKSYMPLLLLTNLLAPLQVLWTLFAPSRINWRGNLMEIGSDGQFTMLKRRSYS